MTMDSPQRVVILNSKGGSGKTTLATNLAAYFAHTQHKTALLDFDNQGSATFWLSKRDSDLPPIQSIPAYKYTQNVTRSWFLRTEPGTERVVVDSPAGIDLTTFQRTMGDANAILIPVLPSDIDIHAVSHCIADLLLLAKWHNRRQRIAVVANRVKKNALVYKKLESFLASLGIPFLTTLRDTTQYIKAADQGIGIHELKSYRIKEDLKSWSPITTWLEGIEKEDHLEKTNCVRH